MKLPAGWKMVELGNKELISEIKSGFPCGKHNSNGDGFIHLRPMNISREGLVDMSDLRFIPRNAHKNIENYLLKKGDVLFNNTNSFELVGKTAVVKKEGVGCVYSNHHTRIRVNTKKLDSTFLAYVLHSMWQKGVFMEICNSFVSQSGVSGKILSKVFIPVPPLDEQEKIVAKLTESQHILDEAIFSFKEVEKRLESVMPSALHKLIPDDESELPEGWETVELQEVAEVNPKKGEIRGVSDDTKITFVPMAAVSEYTGTIESPEVRKLGKVRKGYTYFAEGDVLFAKITPCMENGKSAIARNLKNGIGFGTTEFHVIRPSKKIKAEFIYAILRSTTFRHIAQQNMTGTAGQARVPTDFMKSYRFALPPFKEQEKIVARLAQIKEQVNLALSLYTEAKKRTESIQQALLQKAFRGELVYEKVPVKEEKIEWFKLKQIIGIIIRNLGMNASLRGEMVLAKYTYFVQELFGVQAGLNFQKNNFGPYTPSIKKAILGSAFNKDKFFTVKGTGTKQVYALGQNSGKLFKYQNAQLKQTEEAMNILNHIIGNLPSDKIELLATVCKIIQDANTTDPEIIWQGMKDWKVEGRNGKSKADIFGKEATLLCLEFIQAQEWDKKLLLI